MASVATPVPAGHPPGVPTGEPGVGTGTLERTIAVIERRWAWVLGGLLLLSGALLLYMGRGLTFFYDDWDWVLHDYGGGLSYLVVPHVGNISVFPAAVYKALFHLVGLNHYAVFRSVVIVLHLMCGALVFVLAQRRLARVHALLAASLVLFLGAAWEDLLWAFQVGYMLSIAGGLAAWVLIERRSPWADLAAMLCLVIAAGSSSLGIPIMVGVAVELAWERRWGTAWVVLVPAALYGLWYVTNGESEVTANSLINAPGYAADLAAAAFGALVGRGLEWGRPIAVVAVLVILWRLSRLRPVSPRLAGLVATGLALWALTAATRSTISVPETSRYTYLGAVVIVLVGVELLRGVRVSPRATALASVMVLYFAVTSLTLLHAGASGLRTTSKKVAAELGALELAAAYAPPLYRPDPQLAPNVVAGLYLHTVRSIGSSPADTPAQIAASDPTARVGADGVLMAVEAPRLSALGATRASSLAPAPTVIALSSATQSQHAGCVDLVPSAGATMVAALILPSGGVTIRDRGSGPASLAYRRFGEPFASPTSLAPGSAAVLRPARDASDVPWQLQASSTSALVVCGLTA
jgi:hypothetical protein